MASPVSAPPVIGLTSTIPVEILFAAGIKPIDLNNLFITSLQPERLIEEAESAGFAPNICAWIKGIYATVMAHRINRVIAVTGGDCSNTIALSELFATKGVEIIPFEYPLDRDRHKLAVQMDRLRSYFSVTWDMVGQAKQRLDGIRGKLKDMDTLTYRENVVTGYENHLFLVSSSDFGSDPDRYERDLDAFLKEARRRPPQDGKVRIGYVGVPPITGNLYEYMESLGGRVVFNETQRQFSMPNQTQDIVDQYLEYTYPYEIWGRIADIRKAIEERQLDGLIHYTQTFCFRQIHDIIFRENMTLPILTIEGDKPGRIDGRTALRLETFIEMLKKQGRSMGSSRS